MLAADPTPDERDRYGRLLRHVYLAGGRSVAEVLLGGGFGREYHLRPRLRRWFCSESEALNAGWRASKR